MEIAEFEKDGFLFVGSRKFLYIISGGARNRNEPATHNA